MSSLPSDNETQRQRRQNEGYPEELRQSWREEEEGGPAPDHNSQIPQRFKEERESRLRDSN